MMKRISNAAVIGMLILSISCSEGMKKVAIATGIGCAVGFGAGAIYDELQRKKTNKGKKFKQDQMFAAFKKKKSNNKGKMVGLGVGCAAGLGTGLYLKMMYEDMQENFKDKGVELLKVEGPDGEVTELQVKMDGNINFVANKSDFQGPAQANMVKLSEALAAYPDTNVKIMGYTSGTGSVASNIPLSQDRADAAKKELEKNNIDGSRITAEGKGNTNPLPGTKVTDKVNRRVEIHILPKK